MPDAPEPGARSPGQLIDELCDRFENGWLAGTPVPLEAVVGTVPEAVRPGLFRELINLEREYRSKTRRPITIAEARNRFADLGSWAEPAIEEAFGETAVWAEDRQPDAASPAGNAPAGAPTLGQDTVTVGSPGAAADPRDTLPPAPPGYDLIKRLGGGGMGDVYLARPHASERVVAMKFVRGGPEAVERFLVELRAQAELDHPNIVRVLSEDYCRADPYFTMEYARGGNLAKHVEDRGPLPPADAARLVATVARAIQYAHEKGIIHRDLKPSNILLAGDGSPATPKVSDFGLAKRLDRDDRLTIGTSVLGTPGYMPPEQISRRNGEVGPASDVYGLGASLFHLLTGRPPFVGDSREEIVSSVLSDPPTRPRAIRADIPMELEGVVVKCLEKDSADRYPSAAALIADLDRFLAGQKPAAPPLTPLRRARRWVGRNRGRLAAGIAAAATVAAAVAIALLLVPPPPVPQQPDGSASTAPPPQTPPDPLVGIERRLRDGERVVLVPEAGLPPWHRWRLSPAQFGPHPQAAPGTPGPATFHQELPCLLELLPDPILRQYRFTAEIQQLVGSSPDACVGLFVGLDTHAVSADRTMHTMFAVRYIDRAPAGQTAPVEVGPVMFVQGGEYAGTPAWTSNAEFRFPTRESWPAGWRRLTVEVTDQRVTFLWADSPGGKPVVVHSPTAARAAQDYGRLHKFMRLYAPGANPAPPVWRPHGPIGVLCYRSTVAVKNVVIEPIP